MSNPEEREGESRTAEEDKFTEAAEQEREERSELGRRLREERFDEDDDGEPPA